MGNQKIILLDVDGVVIKARHKYFSEKYSEEYNVPIDEIIPFFKNEYKKAAVGKVDIKDLLPPYLDRWGWDKSVDDFLLYWFESEKDADDQVVSIVKKLREKGFKVYIASDNEQRRAEYLMNEVGLNTVFNGDFFSAGLGVTKSDGSFFQKIATQLNCSESDIHYWDDDPDNVSVANGVGINSFFYDDYGQFIRDLDQLFPDEMNDVMAYDTDDFYCDLVLSNRIKVDIVRETETLLAFCHTRPSWTTHIVIIPKKHIPKLSDLQDLSLIRQIFEVAKEIIIEQNLDEKNYKIITNGGTFQDSKHLHFHLVSGEKK